MATDKGSVVAVLSGGLDSTTLLYYLLYGGYHVTSAVSFNYGQRHKKELEYAARTAEKLRIRHRIIDLHAAGLTDALSESGSSLVSDTDVPEGHYAEENMKATVVPNRNMIMLSIAGGIAVAEGANGIATGVHAGDHFIYPDCRPGFIAAANEALALGNEGFGNLFSEPILTPFSNWTKAQIANAAINLRVPLEETWSCYKGGEKHCGKCGTCVERLEAIDEAVCAYDGEHYNQYGTLHYDKTEYEDSLFWRNVVAEAAQR